MAARVNDPARDIAAGFGESDFQDDILDAQQPMGIESEQRQLSEDQQLEQLDVLEGLRQMQSADPIRWKLYRYGYEDEKFNGYVADVNTSSLQQEFIKKKYGGGHYKVRGFFSNGKYAAQRSISIAGEPVLFVPNQENGMQAPSQSGFNLAEFMTAQQRIDNQRREADERRAREDEQRAERRSKENRDFILAIGAVVAPVITAVVGRVSPVAPTQPVDIAGLVTALRKDTPTENPISGMKGMLEIMTMMRELMPGGDSGGSDTAEIVKAVAGIAGPALSAFTQARQQAAPARARMNRPDPTQQPSQPVVIEATPVAQPRPVTVPAQPVAPAQPVPGEAPTVLQASGPSIHSGVDLSAPSVPMTSEQSSMFAQLKPQVDALVQMARDGQDAAAVGELFYDQFLASTDDDTYDRLCSLFENPNTLNQIGLFNTGVKEFRPWFETLQATIIHKIKQEEAQATGQNAPAPPDPS